MSTRDHCTTCADESVPGNCARFRCYCGHEKCWAYDSWVEARAQPLQTFTPKVDARMAKSWAERDEPTWLDK